MDESMALEIRNKCESCEKPLAADRRSLYLHLRVHFLPGVHRRRCKASVQIAAANWSVDRCPAPPVSI